ncbi:MAG: shikimate kinase [Leptonema sp. (in: bacteria)]
MRIAFIGPRGAGKSKISRKFSKKTNKLLLITDQLVCYEAGGRTIEEIVREEGWESFRNREYEILKKLNNLKNNIILDCGGGILFDIDPVSKEEIVSMRKIELLQLNTKIIYILRDIEWLLNKDLKNSQRPELDKNRQYLEILRFRLPIYEKYAHYVLDMRNKSLEEGVEELLKKFH